MPHKPKYGEGIVIVLDVGPAVRASTETTFYSQSKTCLIRILQRKIFTDKCRDMVGIVLFGTDDTDNHLAFDDEYQHITVLRPPRSVDWDVIKLAENLPRGNSQGDWLDAVVVAMDLLQDSDGITCGTKKIVLMTDFSSDFSDDNTDQIINGLKDEEVELTVIGPLLDEDDEVDEMDGCDPSSSTSNGCSPIKRHCGRKPPLPNWNGKCKTPCQLAAESLIKRMVAEVNGIMCSFEEAIAQLIFFEKETQGSANWNAMMDIGPDLRIPIVGKIKLKRMTGSSWKKAYLEDEDAPIIPETSFHKKDENQTFVEKDDVITGFRYGTTLVPFGEQDAKLKYTPEVPGAVLSILGFTRTRHVPLTLRSGEQVLIVTAKDGDEDGAVALSALIQALKELDMVAITRKVYRKNLNPILGMLFPDITTNYECLIWVGLPFQEDARTFSFPSLDKWKMRVTDDKRDLMDQLITDMDLGAAQDNEEVLDPIVSLNPQLQHYFNCLTYRALYPSNPLPPPEQHIVNLLSPPQHQREARDLLIQNMKHLFPTKRQNKKKKTDLFLNNSKDGEADVPTTDTNTALITSDLMRGPIRKISTALPVEDFLAMLRGNQPNYPEICSQMQDVLLQMTESLSGDLSTDRILLEKLIDAIKSFRTEAAAIDPAPFNTFARQLKQVAKARAFLQLWIHVTRENLGLVTQSENLKSNVSSEEANQFLNMEEEQPEAPSVVRHEEDYDDMLDDL